MREIALEILSLIARFEPELRSLDDQEIRQRTDPKKWSRKEILGHLIDSACNNQQKIVRMMQQECLEFPGYAQDDWVDLQKWSDANYASMVDLWIATNKHIAHLAENMGQRYLDHTIMIGNAGPFKLGFVIPDYVEHMKHHLKQIFPDANLDHNFQNVYGA